MAGFTNYLALSTRILKNYNGKEKLAVIMDLDETVLDNSQYQIELIENIFSRINYWIDHNYTTFAHNMLISRG